jgi:P27 family predicted phage terminase small subunit
MPNITKSREEKQKKGTLRAERDVEKPILPKKLRAVPKAPYKYRGDKDANAHWKRFCGYLLEEGRLNDSDLPIIELLVDSWVTYDIATAKIKELGDDVVKTQFNKVNQEYETLTKWYDVQKKEQERLLKLSSEMGFTPASRSRVGIVSDNTNKNDADSLRSHLYNGPRIANG